MNAVLRKSAVIVLAASGMTVAVAMPASASGKDGLVNVTTGNINVVRDVNVAAVVPVVAQLCGIDVSIPANVAVLSKAAQKVDATGKSYTVCRVAGGDVKIVQN